MSDEGPNEQMLDVNYDGVCYGVTNMVGRSIAYLRDFFKENGVLIPEDAEITIFSMGPNEDVSETILKRGPDILSKGLVNGVFIILQGEAIEVTDAYVLSSEDLVVEFTQRDAESS